MSNFHILLDGNSIVSIIFDCALSGLILACLTVYISNLSSSNAIIKQRKIDNEKNQVRINMILDEIESIQKEARQNYKNAETSHDKSKALYAYESVERCLNQFQINLKREDRVKNESK